MKKTSFYRKTTFHLLRLSSLLISAILGVFCNFGAVLYGPAPLPLYGMRVAKFNVSGTIRSADQSLPVGGLSVSFSDTSISRIFDSTRTDSLGKYFLEFLEPRIEQTGKLMVKDIDSTENGIYLEKDTLVNLPEGSSIIDLKLDRSNQ
jgi:hypothetical protein